MKIVKVFSHVVKLGGKIAGIGSKVVEKVDHIIHYKEYEKAKKRARVCKIVLGIAGGVLFVLLFPYKLIVEKNGDFELRSLLLRIYRKTEPYNVPEGGNDEFDILGVEDGDEDCTVIEAVELVD